MAGIIIPDNSEAPMMPSLANTEIGKRNAMITGNRAQNLSDAALPSLIISLLKQQEARNIEATNEEAV